MGADLSPTVRRIAIAALLCVPLAAAGQDQPPRFRSGVDVTSVEVTVVDDRGRPILGLDPADFVVKVDGEPRRVVSADWVPLTQPEGAPKPPPPPEGYSSNEGGTGGRLIIIVVDQPNIRFGGFLGIRNAVNGFIDRLQPSDRVALVGIGPGAPSVPFTADHARVKKAVEKTTGQRSTLKRGFYEIAISEAMAIRRGDGMTLERVQKRECGDPAAARSQGDGARIEMCFSSVYAESEALAATGAYDGEQTMGIFRDLLRALRSVNAPNTMVLVTEGFPIDDQHPSFAEIDKLAAAARTSIYVLQLDDQAFDIARATAGEPGSRFLDRVEKSAGVEMLAHATRGSLFNIVAGADGVFERIESELTGHYLVAVESNPADRDGRAHGIDVAVNRRGVTVRSRRSVTIEADRPRTARETMLAALTSPLLLSALPLRVATFALQEQGPEQNVQLLIHADVGAGYTAPRPVSIAYMFTDRDGRIVESQSASARLTPVMNGVPSPLQFTGGASLPPGEYTLKLAIVEGDLVGSIEHQVNATVLGTGAIRFSELLVGGPVDGAPPPRPIVGHTISFGTVQGYLEAYGPGTRALTAKYEVAASLDGPALLSVDAPRRSAGDERAIFNQVVPVRQLPRGKYVLRAVVSGESGLEKSPLMFTRTFEIAPPAVAMTSAESAAPAPPSATELFLPVGEEVFERPFDLKVLLQPRLVEAFRRRAGRNAAAFDKGVAQLEAGDYPQAETTLKSAIDADSDSTAPLTYLAAVFAAAGHDLEASSAWQTALIEGGDVPEIYALLGDALLRQRNLPQARAILEEAAGKWPSDTRFAKPMAMLYATLGLGREAVRTLQRHLETNPQDVAALFMGVEWIYNLHSLGAVARTRAEDLKMARTYAAAYERANGPQLALVKQWIGFLEGRP